MTIVQQLNAYHVSEGKLFTVIWNDLTVWSKFFYNVILFFCVNLPILEGTHLKWTKNDFWRFPKFHKMCSNLLSTNQYVLFAVQKPLFQKIRKTFKNNRFLFTLWNKKSCFFSWIFSFHISKVVFLNLFLGQKWLVKLKDWFPGLKYLFVLGNFHTNLAQIFRYYMPK